MVQRGVSVLTPTVNHTVHCQQQLHCCINVLTRMGRWRLCCVLLLPLIFYMDCQGLILETQQHLVKTIGKEPDVTPICTNDTQHVVIMIVCWIRTERNWGEECRLLYKHGQDFEYGCDSRFRLMTENRTVFLHLTNLTSVDSGNYTCECTKHGGTLILHLNVTVEGKVDENSSSSTEMPFSYVVLGVIIFIILTGVILGFIYRKHLHGQQSEPITSDPDMEPEDIEPYSTFIQRENGLYSVARIHNVKTNANNSNVFARDDTNLGMPL